MALAALLVRIGADLSDLNKGLTQADRDIQKFGKKLTKMGGALSKNLTAPILGVGAALGAAAINVGSFADSLLDLVDQTGLSAKTLQEFRHVANVAGVESDVLAMAAIKLTTAMQSGGEQSKQLSGALSKLGLSATTAGGGLVSMDTLLPQIVGKLQGVSDVTTRNAIAADIFGKSWAELAPVLGLGAGAMEKARKEANALGLVMSDKDLQAADDFRRGLGTLKETMGAIVREIGVGVLPIMQGLVKLLQENVVPAVRSVVQWFNDLSPTTKIVIGVVAGLAAAIGPLLAALGGIMAIWPLIVAGFTAATGPIGGIILAIGGLTAAGIALWKNWDRVKLQFVLAWTAMKDAAFTAIGGILNVLVALTSKIPLVGDKVLDLKTRFDELAQKSLLDAMDTIGKLEDKINSSATATVTLTGAVTKLGHALAGLPKNISLPGASSTRIGRITPDNPNGAMGPNPNGPFVFTDEMRSGLKPKNITAENHFQQKPGIGSAVMGQMPQIVQAFAEFGPMAAILPVISGAMEKLGPVIEKLIEPLVEVGRIVGDALAPVLEMLAPVVDLVVKLFTVGLEPALKVVVTGFSYFIESLGWVIKGIGTLLDSLPFVSAKGIINAGQAMMDAARAARRNAQASEKATDGLNQLASALTNIPHILNVNALRHLIAGGGGGGGGGGITPGGGGGGTGFPGVTYGNVYITVPGAGDPAAVAENVGRVLEQKRSRGGTSRVVLATA